MKSWNVNWEVQQFEIIFDEELFVFSCLYNCDAKILHEFLGGYIFLSMRSADKQNQLDESLFFQLTEKR
jgi:kindlin 2